MKKEIRPLCVSLALIACGLSPRRGTRRSDRVVATSSTAPRFLNQPDLTFMSRTSVLEIRACLLMENRT